jgi:hypothetical protein
MPLEKLPGSVKKIMNEAKRDSDPWFTKIRGEISAETSIKLHTKIIITQMKVSGACRGHKYRSNSSRYAGEVRIQEAAAGECRIRCRNLCALSNIGCQVIKSTW